MASVTPRISYNNLCQASASVITTPSVASGYAKSWLKDPLRSKTWRSKSGWTIEAGFNDKLDFNEGVSGDATATITADNYTGSELATEIQTQMNSAATDNTYTVTYSDSTYKFTIARDSGSASINLEWATGDNAGYSIGADIGFDTSADDTGATSYTGDYGVYQSRHYVKFDLASCSAVDNSFIHYFNIESSASVKLQADTADTTTDWTNPSVSTSMTIGDVVVSWLTSTNSYRYWRFLIDNTKCSDGYTYVGIPYLGGYLQPPGISNRFAEDYVELSEVGLSDHGAPFQLERDRARSYDLVWVALTSAQKDTISTAASYLRVGRPMFFSLDPQNDPDDAVYAFVRSPVSLQHIPPDHWQMTMSIVEALG
jgi:hypothetical protein